MRAPRWIARAFAVFACFLIPWSVYLGLTLPTRALARHYNVAWAGFDGLLIVAAVVTAVLAARRSSLVQLPAMATGTLLVVDAWFDVVTAGRSAFAMALVLALAAEVPLAVLSWWLAAHANRWGRFAARKDVGPRTVAGPARTVTRDMRKSRVGMLPDHTETA